MKLKVKILISICVGLCILFLMALFVGEDKKPSVIVLKKTQKILLTSPLDFSALDRSKGNEQVVPDSATSEESKNEIEATPPDWKRAHPAFHEFFALREKVLRNPSDQLEFEKTLENPDLLRQSIIILANRSEQSLNDQTQIERIYAVDYLSEALHYKNNIQRSAILRELRELVLQPESDSAEASLELRKAQAADRFEMMMLYFSQAHDDIAGVLSKLETPREIKLAEWALSRIAEQVVQ